MYVYTDRYVLRNMYIYEYGCTVEYSKLNVLWMYMYIYTPMCMYKNIYIYMYLYKYIHLYIDA